MDLFMSNLLHKPENQVTSGIIHGVYFVCSQGRCSCSDNQLFDKLLRRICDFQCDWFHGSHSQ